MVFSYDDVEREFSQVTQRWLEIADALGTVCDLFLGVQYSPVPLEYEFLSLHSTLDSVSRHNQLNPELGTTAL